MSYTHEKRVDGFGAQYQTIITTILYCNKKNMTYFYSPLKYVEHNYDFYTYKIKFIFHKNKAHVFYVYYLNRLFIIL
jgi:hypothetical protein